MDIPKRSRHLEIRIEWLKGRVAEKKLVLGFQRGQTNPSDMLTKCLGVLCLASIRKRLGLNSVDFDGSWKEMSLCRGVLSTG